MGQKTYIRLGPLALVIYLYKRYTFSMKKYFILTTAIILAVNSQTFLFAKDSSKKVSNTGFEQYLTNDIKDLKNLLSDSSAISLEKILLSPVQKTYNDLTKNTNGANREQIFQTNINKAKELASLDVDYANSLPEAYYRIYKEVLANPNTSRDFNLTPTEINNLIANYTKSIFTYMKEDLAFKEKQKANPNLSFEEIFSNLISEDINLLEKYYSANNLSHFLSLESFDETVVKPSEKWNNAALHQKKLIQLAALRVIEADLSCYKQNYRYELARFDFISILINAKTDTKILLGDKDLLITKSAYKYVPFNPGKLTSRNNKFITSLQEINKKKQNPSYDFAPKNTVSQPSQNNKSQNKKTTHQTQLSRDYEPPVPSVYDSPWGAGSVR